ncbi:MAG: hypothetical protein ABR947_05870 [Solirubrobacteraceae bacterium]|jgi:hypothetical protein
MTRARVSALPIVVLLALAGALALSAGPAIGAGAHSAAVSSRTSSKKKAAPKPPARISATVGIGDDSPGMFSNGQFKALHTRIARYVTPYDVIVHPNVDALGRLRQWLNAASRAGIQPLIAFYHSNVTPKRMPSVGTYTQDVKKFLRAFPQVRLLQPWDEANRGTVKEPGDSYTSPSAKQSAQYYLALSSACGRCTIVGLDVLDSTDVPATISYLNQFKKDVGRKHMPRIWGLHNYSDTNRFHDTGTKAVLADTTGQVWLTETGGIAKLSGDFSFNLSRQAKATTYMFALSRLSKRITRLYVYQWTGGNAKHEAFDAGLVDIHGKPRPAYCVVYEQLRRTAKCPYKTVKD